MRPRNINFLFWGDLCWELGSRFRWLRSQIAEIFSSLQLFLIFKIQASRFCSSTFSSRCRTICLKTLSIYTYLIQMNAKRVQVTFNEEQWRIISKMKGFLGNTDADVVRNIVLAWLSEKSFISEAGKKRW